MRADGRVGAQSLGVRDHVGESALVPLLAAVLVSFMVAVATPVEIATVACGADLAGESGRAGAGAGTRAGVCLGVSRGERGEGTRRRVPSILGILGMEGCGGCGGEVARRGRLA